MGDLTKFFLQDLLKLQAASDIRPANEVTAQNPRSAGEGLNVVEVTFDMAELFAAPRKFDIAGEEIIFKRMDSVAGARVDFLAGGRVTSLVPGSRLKHKFDAFTIQAPASRIIPSLFPQSAGFESKTVSTGKITFAIVKRVGYDFKEPDVMHAPPRQLSRAYRQNTAASGGYLGGPTNEQDGIYIDGCSGFRVIVSDLNNPTATISGSFRLWVYAEESGLTEATRWCPGQIVETFAPPATIGRYCSLDYQIAVGVGKIFAQGIDLVTNSPSSDLQFLLQVWSDS